MIIKTLTLWQPWASLMAEGYKTVETRSWKTDYRGLLAIHAAKKNGEKSQDMVELIALGNEHVPVPLEEMPYGAVVCVVNLVAIVPTQEVIWLHPESLPAYEFDYGDYSLGRYAWITKQVYKFAEPVPAIGRQGLWDWEAPDTVEFEEDMW